MSRPFRVRALALAALAAAGCQDYNFNPVGKCVLQPGTQRVRLSDVSTADILFVVDESGSMAGEQQKLAANFDFFIQNLDDYNALRVTRGLDPIDFHVAVTTTSIFFNESRNGSTCSTTCAGATGQNVCCQSSGQPLRQPKSCAAGASVCTGGTACRTDCSGLLGEPYCCDPTTLAAPVTELLSCSAPAGSRCGTLQQHYDFQGCDAGVGVDGWPWARGDFVSWTGAGRANPRVLHFDKELYTGGANRQGFTSEELKSFFVGGTVDAAAVQGNVIVGTCGSGQEQALQAARLAVQKAIDGQQRDTYDLSGNASWTPATRVAGAAAEWPHPNAKLVLVFVGDEDDCSSPADSGGGVVWLPLSPAQDTCVNPSHGELSKQFAVSGVVDYFASLGRPLGAAFIFPAQQSACSGAACTPGLCCDTVCTGSASVCSTGTCGAQSPGNRLWAAANEFRNVGADVVTGSICDPNFGQILASIADIVKPPSGLVLPTLPAADAVTVLRITDRAGLTRKTCRGPAPAGLTEAAAQAQGYDWWFTASRGAIPADTSPVSLFVHINNDTGDCEANPGETYSADYLGRVPAGGCQTEADCASALGGRAADWTCFAGVNASDQCLAPTPGAPGTCICGDLAKNCPAGRAP
jgi:hypothetical protein